MQLGYKNQNRRRCVYAKKNGHFFSNVHIVDRRTYTNVYLLLFCLDIRILKSGDQDSFGLHCHGFHRLLCEAHLYTHQQHHCWLRMIEEMVSILAGHVLLNCDQDYVWAV